MVGDKETKANVSVNSQFDCSSFVNVIWDELPGYKLEAEMTAEPTFNIKFNYVVGKDGQLHCNGWKNISETKSKITATGSIIDPNGNKVINFNKVPVTLQLDDMVTDLDERVYFEYCLTGNWKIRVFVHGNGYVKKVYRVKEK